MKPQRVDVFIDVSNLEIAEAELEGCVQDLSRDLSEHLIGDVTVVAQAPMDVSAGRGRSGLEDALAKAVRTRHHLLILLAPLGVTGDALGLLLDAFAIDPMFGSAQPRYVQRGTDCVWPLPGLDGDWATSMVNASALRFLPELTVTPELLSACTLIRWESLVAVDGLDRTSGSSLCLLLQVLYQLRRRGFRNVVVNRAVALSTLDFPQLHPLLPQEERAQLTAAHPDMAVADAEMSQLVHRRIESLLAQRDPSHSPRRILVDCRGMPPRYNGSAQWILGFLRGLAELESGDAIDVLVYENVAEFHSLAQLYPQFRQSYREPEGPYFAAIGLTQPWELRTVAQLHRRALVNVFCMLDTIAWDILYPPGAIHLGAVWRFIGRHADGLMYISQFTKERFNARFDVSEEVAEDVTHLSFAREEYVDPLLQVDEESDYILVFGNEYDHKDVPATLRVLADAFPLDRVVAFGAALPAASNVTSVESGALEPAEMQRLVANARVIVYPSFYEGFGLPVVEGLAYGRPVVVRRSSLWREIAGCSRLPGTLVEFDDVPSLIEGVGRALAGLPLHGLPSGTQLANNTSPASWKDCVARALALLNTCGDRADGARWLEREQALRLAGL